MYFLFQKSRWKSIVTISIICFIVIGSLIPYFLIPSTILDADNAMISTYGSAYTNLTPKAGMRQTQFSWWEYFNGVPFPDDKISIELDREYYYNYKYDDSFKCDIYRPLTGNGPFPVLINLHGGAWVLGDKQAISIPSFNKIIAAQGFVVFDLRYGLAKIPLILSEMG